MMTEFLKFHVDGKTIYANEATIKWAQRSRIEPSKTKLEFVDGTALTIDEDVVSAAKLANDPA